MTKAYVNAGWDDVPHLTKEMKTDLLASYPPNQRRARAKGLPMMGAGAIYPIPSEDIKVKPFAIPRHFRRAYALDVGWRRTAALWGAFEPEANTWWIYTEHYRAEAEPSIHAASIRARGEWIPGIIDPAARGRGQKDGEDLLQNYKDLGLNLTPAHNAVDAGLLLVWEFLSQSRLKIFSNCENFFIEYEMYRRDEKGRIVKENDHLMDCLRYLIMNGQGVATTLPQAQHVRRIRGPADSAGY